jgi:hypothetical protein
VALDSNAWEVAIPGSTVQDALEGLDRALSQYSGSDLLPRSAVLRFRAHAAARAGVPRLRAVEPQAPSGSPEGS